MLVIQSEHCEWLQQNVRVHVDKCLCETLPSAASRKGYTGSGLAGIGILRNRLYGGCCRALGALASLVTLLQEWLRR